MKIRGLSVSLGADTHLFHGLTLEFAEGSYVVICGPTGSGKTTLARALAGDCPGNVTGEIHGGAVASVWQDPGAQMCGHHLLDEVRLPLDYSCISADVGTQRATHLIQEVGLAHLDPRRDPMTLSGGEQQRLSLAASLAQDSQALILDEATSQLDVPSREMFLRALDWARKGRIVIAIDHDPGVHISRADRFIVLGERGQIAWDGPTLPTDPALGLRLPGSTLGVNYSPPRPLQRPHYDLGFASFPQGAIIALVGPNGSGKSTLLRSLTRKREMLKKGVAWVPQRGLNHLFGATVAQEVGQGRPGYDEWMTAGALEDVADRHPLSLSGGQRQRLALAATLGKENISLALLDEPSYSQDLNGTRAVANMVMRGAPERLTLLATHDHLLIEALATHIVTMGDMKVQDIHEMTR